MLSLIHFELDRSSDIAFVPVGFDWNSCLGLLMTKMRRSQLISCIKSVFPGLSHNHFHQSNFGNDLVQALNRLSVANVGFTGNHRLCM
jgi:hypothetical protein